MDRIWTHRGSSGEATNAGPRSGGWVVTILLGIGGALIGGIVSTALGFGAISGFDLAQLC